jgi:hypothetical protein
VAKSFVLNALRIIGLEEILKLSQAALIKPVILKKAAGEELVVWDDASAPEGSKPPMADPVLAKVLPFKKSISEFEQAIEPRLAPAELARPDEAPINIQSTELILWGRELGKDLSGPSLKKNGVKEYNKSADVYVVKTSALEGKEKFRFAATNGVLVNKKQA